MRAPTSSAPTSTATPRRRPRPALGDTARAARLDVTDAAAVQAVVDEVVSRAGRLDLMFNNAGICWGGDTELLTLDQWNAIIDVNIRGVVHGIAAAYPLMLRQGHGHIVNTASMAGLTAAGQITSYVTTKHAVVGLSLALRSEAVPRGVGVLVVCPAAVETPILDKGAVGGFVGRDYFLQAQGGKPYDADRLARDVLQGRGEEQGDTGEAADRPRSVAVRPARARSDEPPFDAVHRRATGQTGRGAGREISLDIAAMDTEFTLTQKRALAVATVIAIVFGAYFLRGYFILVVVAAVAAYLFSPLYTRLNRRMGTGLSATLTLLAAFAAVIVPLSLFVFLAVVQITTMVERVAVWVQRTDLSALGDQTLKWVNEALARVPFVDVTVTPDSLRGSMTTVAQEVGKWLLGILQGAAGGAFGAITAAILFLYVFISLLTNRDKVLLLIRRLNPLGEEITDLYMSKMGAMVKGTVMGQFVIAVCQGVAGAASIYIAGFHQGFFLFAVLLSALSVIPLGSGIVTIPFGIGMILFGNVFGGIFVIVFHIIVVTNIDNLLRPILVPREARLDSALMLLAVFAGLTMFGAWGIVIGPVLMIIIVTTISVYLAVYKGVPMDQPDEKDRNPSGATPLEPAAGSSERIQPRRRRRQRSPRREAGAEAARYVRRSVRNSTTRLRAS